jgi:exonuclease VII small subunit
VVKIVPLLSCACVCDIVGVYAMANLKKRRCSTVEVDDYATGESSYMKMKSRLEQKEKELEQLCERLKLSEQRKIEVETHFEQAMKVLHGTIRQIEDLAAKLEDVRSELQQETNINDEIVKSMVEENKILKRLWLHLCFPKIQSVHVANCTPLFHSNLFVIFRLHLDLL